MVRSVSDVARYAKKHIIYNIVLADNPLFLQVPDITTLLCLKYDCIESYKIKKEKKNTSISPVNVSGFSYSYVKSVCNAVAARATFLW